MNDLYNKFRFTRKDLFHLYNETVIKFVFKHASLFIEIHDFGNFSNWDLVDSVNAAAESAGLVIPDEMKLIKHVMDFFCDELGYKRTFDEHYSEIHELIMIVVMDHISDGYKFIDPLTRIIIDEFNTRDYSTTMDEIVSRLKNTQQFRFLSYDLLSDAVNSVYDLFVNMDIEEE